jgi:hypothetical protein
MDDLKRSIGLDPAPGQDYLFFSRLGRDVFLVLMKEIHQLNDLLVYQSNGRESFVAEAHKLIAVAAANDVDEDYLAEDYWSDVHDQMFYDDIDVPLSDIFCDAIAYISLYAILIRGLKLLLGEFNQVQSELHRNYAAAARAYPSGELLELVQELRKQSGRELKIFEKRRGDLNRLRLFRNHFMHGDWAGAFQIAAARKTPSAGRPAWSSLTVVSAFRLVTEVLYDLEESLEAPLEALCRVEVKFLDLTEYLHDHPSN